MTAAARGAITTGPWGPVAVLAGALLIAAAPLMRGGNRYVALVVLEGLALIVLAALAAAHGARGGLTRERGVTPHSPLLPLLLLSPLLIAALQLLPLPASLWVRLPGHAAYAQAMAQAGVPLPGWLPLSISPPATLASLLAALPVAAAFLLAYLGTLDVARTVLRTAVAIAFVQVLLALLQVSGGEHSPFYLGAITYGIPLGSFANRNHYANWLAMALAGYIWLAYESAHDGKRRAGGSMRAQANAFTGAHATALWVGGALVIVLGILLSRSRGAALFGLPMAALALALAAIRLTGWKRGWRFALPVAALLVVSAGAMMGFEAALSRLSATQLSSSAGARGVLAHASFDAAMAFWPWGAGWGTYDLAVQRFIPPEIALYPNHAHQDYLEMLLEGGIVFVLLAGCFAWLVLQRAALLVRLALRDRTLDDDAMAAALCGLGLLGLLGHSLVEFNLRIPSNAILGAFLAGVYLRPISRRGPAHDRPAQPHPARHRRRREEPRDVAGDGAHRGG